ncbi:hypothetical protein NCU02309 [Neurospora crassa OR74A]|uniref:Uncharacterized protein n=1 Tax=Neurospora crassa (strain ATCC 24698 / 74-OR23-1A / CBS 708.71 / DSM 1257 / FGSC 987) TaxID=367110 RepID=Q7S561_NEUCR|nr:hypothetical protein NCU02309 [Neurospora crassa OR74A]EAA30717.1 hypothetical protein NCU02309 [Neurospora crassa OR74A]|eukprot:XP_959953.1 hypothetical protein NCU02309 [Neurospora crassa OR74A]
MGIIKVPLLCHLFANVPSGYRGDSTQAVPGWRLGNRDQFQTRKESSRRSKGIGVRDLKTVKGERGTRNKGKGRDVMFDQIVCVKNMRAIMHTKMVNGSAACLWSSEVRRRTTGHVMTLGMTIWKSADGMGRMPASRRDAE